MGEIRVSFLQGTLEASLECADPSDKQEGQKRSVRTTEGRHFRLTLGLGKDSLPASLRTLTHKPTSLVMTLMVEETKVRTTLWKHHSTTKHL